MASKRNIYQKKYIGKDYVAWGSNLILNVEEAWKKISRRARRAIEGAREIKGLTIEKRSGTKEDVDLFRTIWYDANDEELGKGAFKDNQHVYFCFQDKKLVAGIVVTEVGSNLFLHFNGATPEAKKLQIPSLMIWHIVETFHNGTFKYLDIGCSFRKPLQDFFKNWATHEYPILYHPPYLTPSIALTPFGTASLSVPPKSEVNVDEVLSKHFGGKPFTYLPSGKHAIFVALTYLKLKPEDEVYITTTSGSPYISSCVTTAIEAVCTWERKLTKKTKAILVIHEFGFVHPKLEELSAYAKKNKIPLVEDCAYAWQSGKAGSFGDLIIYSLPKFFPVQYGGLLVGVSIDDAELWNVYKCLDIGKRDVVRRQLSPYVHSTDEIAKKRIENYSYLETLFADEGYKSVFKLKEGEVPGAFVLKVKDTPKMKDIVDRMDYFGIECGAFHHNDAVFVPIHQNLSKEHLDYVFGAVRGTLREDGWVLHPAKLLEASQTLTDRQDKPEEHWKKTA